MMNLILGYFAIGVFIYTWVCIKDTRSSSHMTLRQWYVSSLLWIILWFPFLIMLLEEWFEKED
jgi:hypothetical protein